MRGDLRPLVLSDHPLHLTQQLALGRLGALILEREDDLDPSASELVEQQNLVGVATREAIRRMAQKHLERPFRGAVTQPLERRANERRPGNPLVAEHQLRTDNQLAGSGELTQLVDLACARPLRALMIR